MMPNSMRLGIMTRGMSSKQTGLHLPAMNAVPSRNVDRARDPGVVATALVGVFSLVLTGCEGVPTQGELWAQRNLQTIGATYRPQHQRPPLPRLRTSDRLSTYLRFAILNQPRVEAAYFDWAAAVRRITVERSLPDPRLTFESDISNVVLSLMPGLMMDFPGPGKLKAAANVATAESEVKYFAFESSVLQTAFTVKKAYYQLHLVNAKITVNQETLKLLADLEQIARAQNEAGKVTLQDVLRTQIEQERLATAIKNLKDSRNLLMAEFKAALGLRETDAMPPLPARFESTPLSLTSDRVLTFALTHNPRLKAMEAEVRRADAAIRLAHTAQVPDVLASIKADAMSSPTIVTPEIKITLPVWRDKITALIAGAEAAKLAAAARLSAEQIALAVELVDKSFMFRAASRNLELFVERLLPKARQSLEVAQSGYVGGKLEFLNVIDAERTLLDFRLSAIEARVQRELALAELSLIILGRPPENAPVLSSDAYGRAVGDP
jgi:outer membrane protein, heavy metal efflux system